MPRHHGIYSSAELYDVAFSFKEVPRECDFLAAVFERHAGRSATSILELCAGPARNAIELGRRGLRVHALDLCAGMVEHGSALAREAGVALDYRRGDMTDFALEESVDLVAILMDSTSYLLDNEAVLRNLSCVAGALVDGGLYVLEMSHPRTVFDREVHGGVTWTAERDDLRVTVTWGVEGEPFDPTTQVSEVTARMRWERGEERGELVEVAPQRCFTANELRALVTASGRFEWVEAFGALDLDVPFTNEERAWRMVPVLRRR